MLSKRSSIIYTSRQKHGHVGQLLFRTPGGNVFESLISHCDFANSINALLISVEGLSRVINPWINLQEILNK